MYFYPVVSRVRVGLVLFGPSQNAEVEHVFSAEVIAHFLCTTTAIYPRFYNCQA